MTANVRVFSDDDNDFWFDYIADTGDDGESMANLAYLLYTEVRVAGLVLPRGKLLVVGGDTAYHVADQPTLKRQFVKPFQDVWKALDPEARPPTIPVFGIPGNHDYYDELEGFAAQFRARPVNEPSRETAEAVFDRGDDLVLPGYVRTQTASYFALKLPHDWSFWAIDNEIGTLDPRQHAFFNNQRKPKRLIVATPEPTTVNGKKCDPTSSYAMTFEQLGLERAFLDNGALKDVECRLDISGDTHNYQRYWGPGLDAKSGPEYGNVAIPNYASVVSGGGGAFLHPTGVDFGEVKRKKEFPDRAECHAAMVEINLDPRSVWNSGMVALIGGLVTMLLYVTSLLIKPCRAFVDELMSRVWSLDQTRSTFLTDGSSTDYDRRPKPTELGEYRDAAIVLGIALVVGFGIFLASRYAQGRFPRTKPKVPSLRRYRAATLVVISLILAHWASLYVFGHASTQTMIGCILSIFFGLALLVGLTLLAVVLGAQDQPRPKKLLFLGIGIGHGLGQVLVPLTLLQMFSLQAFAGEVAVTGTCWLLALAFGRSRPTLLLAISAVCIAAQLVVPRLVSGPTIYVPGDVLSTLFAVGFAFVVGYIAIGVGLGWYFAVCLGFNGHGNEAASVARIKDWKQFIRFKLGKDGTLTAYVIGIERVAERPADVQPMLIESFVIAPKPLP